MTTRAQHLLARSRGKQLAEKPKRDWQISEATIFVMRCFACGSRIERREQHYKDRVSGERRHVACHEKEERREGRR